MKKKLVEFTEKYSGTFRYAFALNLLVLILIHIFFRPLNVTDDNLFIEMNCNWVYGAADSRLVFINVLIGFLLKSLYFVTTSVPWFDLLSEAIVFLSLSAIAYVFTRVFGSRLGSLLFVIIAIFIAPQAYIRVNFTKTSGVASAAGLALLLYASVSGRNKMAVIEKTPLNTPGKSLFPEARQDQMTSEPVNPDSENTHDSKCFILEFTLGIMLSALGFCYRPMEFLPIAVLVFPAFVLFIIKGHWKKLVFSAVTLVILMFMLSLADYFSYQLSPEWNNYYNLEMLRSDLIDYGFPPYDDNKDRLEALGIKSSAWNLLQSYNYADPEVFSNEVFSEIVQMKGEKRKLSGTAIKEFISEVPKGFFSEPEFYMALIFVVFFLIYAGKRPLSYAAAAGCMLLFTGMYLYLFLNGKYLFERVDMGLFLTISITLALSAAAEREGEEHFRQPEVRIVLLTAGAVLVMSQSFLKDSWRINTLEKAGISRGQTEKFMEMAKDKDHLYLCKMRYPDAENAFEPFDTMPKGMFSNIFILGGWQVFEPITMVPLRNYDVTNPYRDAIGNDRILFVDDDIELTMEYIHDYYDPDAEAIPVGLIGNEYQVYKIQK